MSSKHVKSSLSYALPRRSTPYPATGGEEHQRWEIKMCLRKCVPKSYGSIKTRSFISLPWFATPSFLWWLIFSALLFFWDRRCLRVNLLHISLTPLCRAYKNISALVTSHTSTMRNDLWQQPCPTSKYKAPYLPPTFSLLQFFNSKSHTNREKATHTNPLVHRSLHSELCLIMCFLRVSLCSPGWHQTHRSFPVWAYHILGIWKEFTRLELVFF